MATVASQSITTAGTEVTYSAASGGGDRFLPGTLLHVRNGSASPITMTIVTPGLVDGLAVTDRTVAVPAGEERFVLAPDKLYRSSDGLADITWSDVTTVTFASIRV